MSSDTPREVNQKLGELASQWRTAGSIQKGVTQAVHAAYELGLAVKSAEVERLKQITFCCGDDKKCIGDSCACHALRQRVEELEGLLRLARWFLAGEEIGDLRERIARALEK